MTDPSVGKRIRLRRQALKMTQQQLADAVGVNRATVSQWERGKHLPERNEGALEATLGITITQPAPVPDPAADVLRAAMKERPDLFTNGDRAGIIEALRKIRDRQGRYPPPGEEQAEAG